MSGWRLPRWAARGGCAVLFVLIWLPALESAAGIAISRWAGCNVTEAGPEPCIVAGVDIGHRLYDMSMMFWIAILFMLPLMLLSLIVPLVLFVKWIKRRRRRR